MKHLRHFEIESRAEGRQMAQLSTLVANLDRTVAILSADIKAEVERVRVRDLADPAYPILARSLRARRQNLIATLESLRQRLQHPAA
jgi:hypothetical protein